MIKLVAIDVDDTLLNSQGKLLQFTTEVIKKAIARDIKVVLWTTISWCEAFFE